MFRRSRFSDMRKIFLALNVVGILLIVKGASVKRSASQLKKQASSAGEEKICWNNVTGPDPSEQLDGIAELSKRDVEGLDEKQVDSRWRREDDWSKPDMLIDMQPEGRDPMLTRQEDFDRWLRKRGSAPVEQDPDAARVASKQAELQELLQQLYEAQAAVKMETGEVSRTQQVAQEAQLTLEEATNKVRMLSADLQAAQEAAAATAMRAHTAQLQLSAHDQLMFTARQRVDALSAQMVSVQAELAAAQQAFTLNNSSHLLEAQGRGLERLEASMMQSEKMMPRGITAQRGGFGADIGSDAAALSPSVVSAAISPAMVSAAISSSLADDKHGEAIPASLPYINRQSYNYVYPQ